jgi:hypothetical protein
MMLRELESLLVSAAHDASHLQKAAIEENALNKATRVTRLLTFRHLSNLYGLSEFPPITKCLLRIWLADLKGHPLLALLVALARDPLLRDTAPIVIRASIGEPVKWPILADSLTEAHPNRFSEKMLRSLAQNCAASWTQSGHLRGAVAKIRNRVVPSPHVVAFATLLASMSGFGGPAILSSAWIRVLDLTAEQGLDELRRAEALGLARVRSAGDITEVSVRRQIAATLGVPELEHF